MTVPYADLDTLFLDAGNTLLSIDFEFVAGEIRERGLSCDAETLRRAEAAARPTVSRRIERRESTETEDAFHFYVRTVVEALPAAPQLAGDGLSALIEDLAPALHFPGESNRLWNRVMAGVPEALGALREAGLRLCVVSNADGSVEQGITSAGLRAFFDAVYDSHLVGFEKPDPRFFAHALADSGADPARTLHVGDLYAADVLGARAAGVHTVLLDPFDDWGELDCERHPDLGAVARAVLAARR